MSKDNILGYFTGSTAQFRYHNPWLAEKTKGVQDFFNDLGAGFKNVWYNLTGQTEKTSAYQAQMAREDSAPIRQAEALEKAGLSKYTGGSTSVGTGSYGDGKPTAFEKSIQLASAIMDLKSKKVGIDATEAGIRKSDAETSLIGAQTLGQENTNRTFDQKILADINKTLMDTAYTEAQKKLLEDQSPFIVEKTIAEVQHLTNQAALYLSQRDLAWSQRDYYDEQTGKIALESNMLSKELRDYDFRFNMEKEKHAEAIAKSVSERNHLSKQDKEIVFGLAFKALQMSIMNYDFNYSKQHGLRTTDQVSRFMGINLDSGGQMLSDLTRGLISNPNFFKMFMPASLRNFYSNLGF